MSKIKIFHTADIQVEVRNSAPRYDEFKFMLSKMVDEIKATECNLVAICGDLTEYAVPNEVERKLLLEFINTVADIVDEVVIIKGNHDIIQQASRNTYLNNGQKTIVPDALDILLANPKKNIVYCPTSGVYESNMFNVDYLVWGQKHKYEPVPTKAYNPIEEYKLRSDRPTITLFHDCIRNAINFDGKPITGSDKRPDYKFVTPLVLAGDIHNPSICKLGDSTFTYCSSPIPRNFGEGDYFHNGLKVQNNAIKHGYNLVEFDDETGEFAIEFHPLQQYNMYQTIVLDRVFDLDKFKSLYEPYQSTHSNIKIRIKEDYERILTQLEDIIAIVKLRNQNPTIRIESGKDIQSDTITAEAIDVEKLISIDKIKEVAAEFVTRKVQGSKSIPKEDKNQVALDIVNIFNEELDYFERTNTTLDVVPISVEVSNFMALGDNIKIDFNRGITKVSGSNGTGKSTLYNVIKWLWTDFVYTSQKSNHKKENALILFNNKRPEVDMVEGKIIQLVNGEELVIHKTIERFWKSGTTIENKISESWMDYCDMPETHCTVTYQGKTYQDSEATDFLYSIFGSLSNILRTLFATAPSLFSIINTSSSDLNDEILFNLGLNFFEQMYARYDEIRDKAMSKVSKPACSIGEYNAFIDTRNSKINTIEEEVGKCQSNLDEVNKQIDVVTDAIQELVKQLSKYEQRDLDEAISSLNSIEASIKSDETIVNDEVEAIQRIRDAFVADNIEEQNTIVTAEHTKLEQELSTISAETDNAKHAIEVNEANIKVRRSEIIDEIRTEVETLKDEKHNLETELSQIEQQIKENDNHVTLQRHITDSNIKEAKQKHAALKERIELSISANKTSIANLEQSIKEAETEQVCSMCGRKHTEESFAFAHKSLPSFREQIERLEQEINTLGTKLTESEVEQTSLINQYNDEFEKFAEKYRLTNIAYENDIKKYKQRIDEINKVLADMKEALTKCLAEDQQLITLNHDIETAKETINSNTLHSKEITGKLTELSVLLETYAKRITEHANLVNRELALAEIKIRIATNKDKITQLNLHIMEMTDALRADATINTKIAENKIEQSKLKISADTIRNEIEKKRSDIKVLISQNESDEANIRNAIAYRIADSSMRIYKQIIGKSGLPTHIFSMIRQNLNDSLNEMLSGLGFVLNFNENNELKMIKIDDNMQIKQSVAFSSGMESTFLGLSLLYVLKTKNVSKKINVLFIDEVTGALNDGSDLSYAAKNYQERFKELIHKMKSQFNIFVIDHVIKDLDEDTRYEVVPTENGSLIEQIMNFDIVGLN